MGELEFRNWKRDGRRIYVHELSFTTLGQQSTDNALLVLNALGWMIVGKITHHHFTQAIEFKIVNSKRGVSALKKLNEHYTPILTLTLRKIGYRPTEPVHHRDFYPLLGRDEYVYDICSEAGYFLFATGKEAAKRMFDEKGSMHEERVLIRDGKGPTDITWINGRNLALMRSDLPIGPEAANFYFLPVSRNKLLSVDEFTNLKQQVAARVLTELESIICGDGDWNSPEEIQVLEHLFATCRIALSKGIFANRELVNNVDSSLLCVLT